MDNVWTSDGKIHSCRVDIAVSVFEIIWVQFYKYGIWDEQACLLLGVDIVSGKITNVISDVGLHAQLEAGRGS